MLRLNLPQIYVISNQCQALKLKFIVTKMSSIWANNKPQEVNNFRLKEVKWEELGNIMSLLTGTYDMCHCYLDETQYNHINDQKVL